MRFLAFVVQCPWDWCGNPATTMVETVVGCHPTFPRWQHVTRVPSCEECSQLHIANLVRPA